MILFSFLPEYSEKLSGKNLVVGKENHYFLKK